MGTRHLTIIKKNGEIKLAQYGQWDGYPEGQGVNLLNILKKIDIKKLNSITDELKEVSKEKIDSINNRVDNEPGFNWKNEFPEFSRDTGTDIIDLIYNKGVREIIIDREMLEPNIYIEGTFEIDFDKNKYICCGVEFSLDKLPTEKAFLKKFL